ncbi:MAG: RDD family protein [Prevotella sp.]|nr:RDD family protein [Prevotella sp.]
MAVTTFVTSQHVSLHQRAASLSSRFLAWLIDGSIMVIAYFMIVSVVTIQAYDNPPLAIVCFVIGAIVTLLYPLIMERFNKGQTLGKMALGIQVMNLDGSRPSLSQLLLRWLLLIVDGPLLGSIGMLSIIFTKNSQRLGDLAAGTTVIQKNGYAQLHIRLDDFQYAMPDYVPSYPAAANLSWRQMEVISRVVSAPRSVQRWNNLGALSTKVQQTLKITAHQPPEIFLNILLNDYRYYAGSVG